MKKFLAIIAMMITMLCGSIMLVSCSNDYKKMYLVVEYALPGENGEVVWQGVDPAKGFDYTISEELTSLYMRVKVGGTSKKINSLYISQSVNSSTFLQTSSVSPNETFEVKIKGTGSVRFTITPSQGGTDKAVSFGVNIYKQIEEVLQNENCVPALVAGGSIDLTALTDLIKYKPYGETNQTGVDFTISGVGTLVRDPANLSGGLLGRIFNSADFVPTSEDKLSKNVISEFKSGYNRVALEKIDNRLVLTTLNTASGVNYQLTNGNNVIELTATSIWSEKIAKNDDDTISCKVYVYLVENIKDALLVSYNDNEDPNNSVYGADNKIKDDIDARMEVSDYVTLYNSSADLSVVGMDFSAIKLYTYMNPSIYSYESDPGFKLNVYFNGEKYNYGGMPDNRFGVQVNAITKDGKLAGLKFAVNPNSMSTVTTYNTKIEVEFDAFDFSASDKNPEVYLTKEFVINVDTLASGFNINQKSYQNNIDQLSNAVDNAPYITELDSGEIAKLFTSYEGSIGMPLSIKATPSGAQNSTVYMGIYDGYTVSGNTVSPSEGNYVGMIQLLDRYGFNVSAKMAVAGFGSQFEISKDAQKSAMYLRFNPSVSPANMPNVEHLYMICHVLCTPERFGNTVVNTPRYITFVSKIKLVGAVENIGILDKEEDEFGEGVNLVEYNKTNTALLDFTTTKLYSIDLSEIDIESENGKIKFYNGSEWVDKITADQLSDSGNYKELKFKADTQCEDVIKVISANGKSADLQLKFVSITSSNKVDVRYEDSDIWTYKDGNGKAVVTELKYENRSTDASLSYLAIQSGGSAQFMVCGDGKSANIQSITVKNLIDTSEEYCNILNADGSSYYADHNISSFNSGAVRVTPIGGNVFDVKANSEGYTAIMFVKADFYAWTKDYYGKDVIELQNKYFVFEIATYTPARDLRVSEVNGKDGIIYINDNYKDVAKLELLVKLNSATQEINYSNSEVNAQIKVGYGDDSNPSIYGIKVDTSDLLRHKNESDESKFEVSGLNVYGDDEYISLSNKTITVKALESLDGISSAIIKFKVVQFGDEKEVTEIKYIVKVGSYKATDRIVIDSGVQLFNNIYLNLLDEESKTANVVAYATNKDGDATYTDLGYKINKLNGTEYKEYTGTYLKVAYNKDNNLFTISANTQGGVYEVIIYAKDAAGGANNPSSKKIKVTVSDGKTEATAYLINDITGFVKLTNATEGTYYKLSKDIDFDINHLTTNAEKEALTQWLASERSFAGHLNGQMVIENLDNNATITQNYALKNVSIPNSVVVGTSDNIGLFTNMLATASIKNVVFENAKISVDTSKLTKTTANIGIITAVNNGTIENCNIVLAPSSVVFESGNATINIGLAAGKNDGKIIYQSSGNASNYSYMVDCASASALNVEVSSDVGGRFNIGAIAGINTSEISSDYAYGKGVSVRELIGAVVNLSIVNHSTTADVNLGGLVGNNNTSGTIKNITVTGSITATGNANVGGIAGGNAGTITEVVNFGAEIVGNSSNQNIGGIIGNNTASIVDNVRVMFITFENSEVKVSPATAIISGCGNVGGIIGNTTVTTTLTRAFVESVVLEDNNIIGNTGATLAGLVASGSANATLCFVQANVKTNAATFNKFVSGVTPKYSYFIGEIDGVDTVEYYEADTNKNDNPMSIDTYASDEYEAEFYINWKKNEDVNNGYPYLVYKIDAGAPYYEETLTQTPQEIIVNVDKQYFDINDRFIKLTAEPADWGDNWENYYEIKDGQYVRLTDSEAPEFGSKNYYTATYFKAEDGEGLYMQYEIDDDIVAAAVVYYDEDKGDNIYKLVSDSKGAKGLIEKTVVPSTADGNYSVSIVEGSFAILGNNTIKFTDTGRVVLRFASVYDRNITDTVVIFVEKPLDDDVFNITTSAGLKLTTEDGSNYSTRVNTDSLLGLNLKGDAGKTFDSTKTYMTAKVVSNDEYVDLISTSDSIGKTTTLLDKYQLGQLEVRAKDLPDKISSVDVKIELSVYLDLSKYTGKDGNEVSNYMNNVDALLETRTITITIYNKATDLTVPSNSNIKAETSVAIDINANLVTGYVQGCESATFIARFDEEEDYGEDEEYYIITGDQLQKIWLKTPNHDTVEYLITPINDNAEKLVAKQKDLDPTFSIWDLFDILISHKQSSNGSNGYEYNLNLRLKDEFKYLDLKDQTNKEWRFKVLISANGGELEKPVEFAYVPQQLNSLRIENYSSLVAKTGIAGNVEVEFVSNQSESSLIIPGESGLIKIFAEYNYSYFEDIVISSSTQEIDGKIYFVKFQQMVYNRNSGTYQSLAGVTADGSSLTLRKVSYADNGNSIDDEYDGTIFVRTILEKFVGEKRSFTISVNAKTYDIDMNQIPVSRDKTLISQYRPGVYVSVTNALEDIYPTEVNGVTQNQSIYLVEQGSQVSMIEALVYAYEYNVQPTYEILKLRVGGSWNENKDWEEIAPTDESVLLVKQFNTGVTSDGAAIVKYLIRLSKNAEQPFKVVLKVRLIDNGVDLTESSETLLFCPVPFIPKAVSLEGITSDDFIVPVNTSKTINLTWSTMSPVLSTETQNLINAAIDPSKVDLLDVFYINTSEGKEYFRNYVKTETDEDAGKSFLISGKDNNYIIESKKNEDPIRVYFNLWYKYKFIKEGNKLTKVEVEFSTTPSDHLLTYSFDLCLTLQTTEDAPTPIYDVGDLLAMGDGVDGILMNDIVINLDGNSDVDSEGKTISLGPWKPLSSKISSLDGNGKIISFVGNVLNVAIQSSSDENAMNMGLLFETISEDTILKNIAINISGLGESAVYTLYIKDENVPTASVNFGLLAGRNDGLVYNCEIISKSAKTFELIVGDKYNLTFGGLVGLNNGNITNSRVGTEYFERITALSSGYSSVREICYPINLRSVGRIAGLVGENAAGAIISSSFVANTSIENHSKIGDTTRTRTAGFVATNSGTVAYSYVKGVESTILETHLRTTQGMVYASGAGSVAGFAYYNSGTIHDCYSNIECKSLSSAVAGFVYDTSTGSLYQCYSASKVDSAEDTTLATELPFIGVGIDEDNAQQLLSSANVVSCYYFKDGKTSYDTNYLVDENDVQPKGLTETGFLNISNLNNFSFVEYGTPEQKLNGVWTNSTAVDRNRSTYALGSTSLPELTSANQIARSVRVLISGIGEGNDKTINEYEYVTNYEKGSQNNPYVIRSAEEYQAVFVDGEKVGGIDVDGDKIDDKKYFVANVRFIDDINFGTTIGEATQYIDIGTRDNYILGSGNQNSNNSPVLTVIDGNGMTISNIAINYAQNETSSTLGLFGETEYSIIKGLTLKYADNGGSTTATYVGGVAGTAQDTYMIDLTLDNRVELRGRNVVGGVVGKLTGAQSGLYNITSNLSAVSGYNDQIYSYKAIAGLEEIDDTYISYAGGIAGIIDSDGSDGYITKLTVNGANIKAQRAGGIAGYIGKNIDAKRLTYYITTNSQICGSEVVGGLIAENHADIQLSQVNSQNIETQYGYDQHFGEYINRDDIIITEEDGSQTTQYETINKEDTAYGNLSAVVGAKVIGGFIGKNFGGDINDSLTKANISHETNIATNNPNYTVYNWGDLTTVGGFIGEAHGGNITNVYAQNYIELNYIEDDNMVYANIVGGLIGRAMKESASQNKFGMDNVVALNFFDKLQVERIDGSKQTVAYVVGVVDEDVYNCLNTKSHGQPNSAVVNYGVFNASETNEEAYRGDKITKTPVQNAQSINMQMLYKDGSSVQQDIFNTLFASWNSSIWEKIYTRYTPNLILDSTNDYYTIYNEEDIKQMEYDPDGNFILMEDVDVSAGNYVVFNEFRGTLFGVKKLDKPSDPNSGRYTKFNITLSPDAAAYNGAGFFRHTIGARIGNIGFSYLTVALATSDRTKSGYQLFGGVSATDEDGRFEQIDVTHYNDETSHPNTIQTNEVTVDVVGSIVAQSTRSEILACSSSLEYNFATISGANIGGLVGKINGLAKQDDGLQAGASYIEGLISGSVYNGSMFITGQGANIGGLVAEAQYTRISSSFVAKENDEGPKECIDIKLLNNANNTIGGIVATSDNTTIGDSQAYISVKVMDEAARNFGTQYIGGIIAKANSGVGTESTINNSNARLVIEGKDDGDGCVGMNVSTAIIGGIVGSADNNVIKLTGVASEIIMAEHTEAPPVIFGTITLGGIVGKNDINNSISEGTYKLTIENAVAILDVKHSYDTEFIGGGIIGLANESYSLTNVASMGYIHANNTLEAANAGNNPTATLLGGLIGAVDDDSAPGKIESSYAALTLSTAGVFSGTVGTGDDAVKHIVSTGGIIGSVNSSSTITVGEEVIYSSDYTLALEEHNVFDNLDKIINVTADVLTTEIMLDEPQPEAEQSIVYFKGWTRAVGAGYVKEELYLPKNKYGLPMPPNTANLLYDLNIWTVAKNVEGGAETVYVYTAQEGKSYYPIRVDDDYNNFVTEPKASNPYNYYLFNEENGIFSKSDRTLKGVLLGNNITLTNNTNAMFKAIDKHSAVSNINIELNSDVALYGDYALIASTNDGTIFMVGIACEDATVKDGFACLTAVNNGVVSNCYSYGVINSAGASIGGLVGKNTTYATITDSYFSGILQNVSSTPDQNGIYNVELVGSGIANTNAGYIANTYTAGQSQYVIGEPEEDARYSNVFYDYYATFVYKVNKNNEVLPLNDYESLDGLGVVGYTTIDLQAVDVTTSVTTSSVFASLSDNNITNNWKVYSMHNWDEINSDPDGTSEVDVTYNYGYPVKKIKQKWYREQILDIPAIRAKKTGNGTFEQLMKDGQPIINPDDCKDKYSGKLVVHEEYDEQKGAMVILACFDSNPFLISNLGVMSLINETASSVVEGTVVKSRYFELENNITMFNAAEANKLQDGEELLIKGPQIGVVNAFEGVFSSAPNKLEPSESYYKLDAALASTEDPEYYDTNKLLIAELAGKTITNLNGSALFTRTGNGSIISNIQLKGIRTTDAPLILNVGYPEGEGNSISTVYKVRIGSVAASSDNGNKAGFVHTVNAGATLKLRSVSTRIAFTANDSTPIAAGIVAVNRGTIVTDSMDLEVTMQKASEKVAGFVGSNYGEITTGSLKLMFKDIEQINSISGFASINGDEQNSGEIYADEISIEAKGLTTARLAGLVDTMNLGSVTGKVKYATDENLEAKTFGGAIAILNGGELNCESLTAADANFEIKSTTDDVFGGLVAIANGGSITKGVIDSNFAIKGNSANNSAYGFVIGKYACSEGSLPLNGISYEINGSDRSFVVSDGFNVGGIIGMAGSGEFTITSDKPGVAIAVAGAGNVGGFIGQYNASESLRFKGDKNWPVNDSYAMIDIATTASTGDKNFYNFGGLIGYWNSTKTLTAEGISISNSNTVLTEPSDCLEYFKIPDNLATSNKVHDFLLENIGGVVGKSLAGIENAVNTAKIGVEITNKPETIKDGKPTNTNIIQGIGVNGARADSLHTLMQFSNVGGLAGLMDLEDADTPPSVTGQNSGSIYGMYRVGGLVGGVKGSVEVNLQKIVERQDLDPSQKTHIVGLVDVGGLIGIGEGDTFFVGLRTEKNGLADANIYGVANVGGLIGSANGIAIYGAYVGPFDDKEETDDTLTVYGNMNVGGLAGIVNGPVDTRKSGYSTDIGNTGGGVDVRVSANVVGTIFTYDLKPKKEINIQQCYFLPTNIGGVIGYVTSKKSSSENSNTNIIFGKITSSANVITEEEYEITEGNCVTVNMHTNFVGDPTATGSIANNGGFIYYLATRYGINTRNESKVKLKRYDTMNSGIGGFIGTFKANTIEGNDGAIEIPKFFDDSQCNANTYAPYGINVGGLIGFLDCQKDKIYPNEIALPKLMGGANVAGKIFVGGYIGRTTGFDKENGKPTFFSSSTNTLGSVNVQQYNYIDDEGKQATNILAGSCIGGIIGHVTGNVRDIQLKPAQGQTESPIKVFNSDPDGASSNHIGTLVGRVDGNIENCSIDPLFCDASKKNIETANGSTKYKSVQYAANYTDNPAGVIQSPKVYNYGGLVGMVAANSKVVINGLHYYAFTVDVILSKSFTDSDTLAQNVVLEGGQDAVTQSKAEQQVITLIAHYINTLKIDISYSALNDLYDGMDSHIKNKFDHNPLNESTRGWAKEYTTFRAMSRLINQDEDTGDSQQLVYNAAFITEVGTKYATEKNGDYTQFRTSDIAYTVYQPDGQPAKLYCKQGVATEVSLPWEDAMANVNSSIGNAVGIAEIGSMPSYKDFNNSGATGYNDWIKMAERTLMQLPTFKSETELSFVNRHMYLQDLCEVDNDQPTAIRKYGNEEDGMNETKLSANQFWLGLKQYETECGLKAEGNVFGYGGDHRVKQYRFNVTNENNNTDTPMPGLTMGYTAVASDSWFDKLQSKNIDKTYKEEMKKVFVFEVVYNAKTDITYTITKGTGVENETGLLTFNSMADKYYVDTIAVSTPGSATMSPSGSIFEVCGMQQDITLTFTTTPDPPKPFYLHVRDFFMGLAAGLIAFVAVVAAPYSGGLSLTLLQMEVLLLAGLACLAVAAAIELGHQISLLDPAVTTYTNLHAQTALNIKSYGTTSTVRVYPFIEADSSYGALGLIYVRSLEEIDGRFSSASDDAVIVDQYVRYKDGNIMTYTDDDGNKKPVVMSVTYISTGSGATVPTDSDASIRITKDDIKQTVGENNILYKIVPNKKDIYIPKYYRSGNGELYIYPDSTTMDRRLLENSSIIDAEEKFGEDNYLDIDGYIYIGVTDTEKCTYYNEDECIIEGTPIGNHVAENYQVPLTYTAPMKYNLKKCSSNEGGTMVGTIKMPTDKIFWAEGSGQGDVSVNLTHYVKDKPIEGYPFTAKYDGGTIYLVPEGYSGAISLDGTDIDPVSKKYVAHKDGSLNTSGISSAILKKAGADVADNYMLELNKSGGAITKQITYYLYYPKVMDGGTNILEAKSDDACFAAWKRVPNNYTVNLYRKSDNKQIKFTVTAEGLKADGIILTKLDDYYVKNSGDIGEYYELKSVPVEGAADHAYVLYKREAITTYNPDSTYSDRLFYRLIPGAKTNGYNLNDYNKYKYESGDLIIYTRYKFKSNIFNISVKSSDDTTKKFSEYFGTGYRNNSILFAESVRFTLSERTKKTVDGKNVIIHTITCSAPPTIK